MPAREAEKIKKDRLTKKFYEIGRIVNERHGVVLLGSEGKESLLKASGFDHFR